MNNTIHVNDTLVVFLNDGRIAIGRDDGGLVTIQGDEVKPLMDTIARILSSPYTDTSAIEEAGYCNVLSWAIADVTQLRAEKDELQAAGLELAEEAVRQRHLARLWKQVAKRLWSRCKWRTREIEETYGWVNSLQTELAEWKQAAEEAQDVQGGVRVPLVGELSSKTTPADFARFAEMAGERHG